MVSPIIMRSNRFLGNNLVNHELITLDQLEDANNVMLDKIDSESIKEASILRILMWELETLKEADLIDFQVENYDIGLVDLGFYSYLNNMKDLYSIDDCWSTWTVPFDHENGFFFLATAYRMSKPVMDFWNEKLDGKIEWFAAEIGSISTLLENAEQEQKAALANS